MNIAVYCASREDLEEKYVAPAKALGEWIGQNGHTLVYGGVKAGLMHTVAQAAYDAGAHIVGVVPMRFMARTDAVVHEVIECHDLGDRKVIMMDRADAFVVLPGGLGTLDEWLSTLSQIIVNVDDHRPIFVVNVDGMYTHQLEQLRITANSPFARGKHIDCSIEVPDAQALIAELQKMQ
ncbi:MAG: TIGR00730 family Rossman fold protein [Bacteroidales bacterium]|nr:TIGR00730 family Rossman fold protein [Bacteroidales bacterium]